jgi:hypothetical protein
MTTYLIRADAPDSGDDAAPGEPEGIDGQWRMVFMFYNGQNIMTDSPNYAVTDALRAAFDTAGVTGATYLPMVVARGDQFDIASPGVNLPHFRQLVATGQQGVDDLWMEGRTQLHISQRALDIIREVGDDGVLAVSDDEPREEWTPWGARSS